MTYQQVNISKDDDDKYLFSACIGSTGFSLYTDIQAEDWLSGSWE